MKEQLPLYSVRPSCPPSEVPSGCGCRGDSLMGQGWIDVYDSFFPLRWLSEAETLPSKPLTSFSVLGVLFCFCFFNCKVELQKNTQIQPSDFS